MNRWVSRWSARSARLATSSAAASTPATCSSSSTTSAPRTSPDLRPGSLRFGSTRSGHGGPRLPAPGVGHAEGAEGGDAERHAVRERNLPPQIGREAGVEQHVPLVDADEHRTDHERSDQRDAHDGAVEDGVHEALAAGVAPALDVEPPRRPVRRRAGVHRPHDTCARMRRVDCRHARSRADVGVPPAVARLSGDTDGRLPPDGLLRRLPGSSLQSIAAIYAHAVITEDAGVHDMLGREPLYQAPQWRRLGLPPQVWLDPPWAATFEPDVPALRSYASAVYDA